MANPAGDGADRSRKATFFISTGSCGTQRVAKALQGRYSDLVVAKHEPMLEGYEPRNNFVDYHLGKSFDPSPPLTMHLEYISRTLEVRDYVETGWPVYGALPYLIQILGPRSKVVHLHRDPVNTAASLTTHRVYQRHKWSSAVALTPFDSGVVQSELSEKWNEMSEFEKCLFWWTEINSFALELRQAADVEWLDLSYEDLFHGAGFEDLRAFLSLPPREGSGDLKEQGPDHVKRRTTETIDPSTLSAYPQAEAVADELGYGEKTVEPELIASRYTIGPASAAMSEVRSRLKGEARRWRRRIALYARVDPTLLPKRMGDLAQRSARDVDISGLPENLRPSEFERWVTDEGRFRANWFTSSIRMLSDVLGGRQLDRLLEIGSYEGLSSIWFSHYSPGVEVICIDTFGGSPEHDPGLSVGIEDSFDSNIALLAHGSSRVTKVKGSSRDVLPEMGEEKSFDLVYIDGSHIAVDVQADAELAWPLLRPGGVMIFDDYLWMGGDSWRDRPLLGVNAFLKQTRSKYRVLHSGYAIAIEKQKAAA